MPATMTAFRLSLLALVLPVLALAQGAKAPQGTKAPQSTKAPQAPKAPQNAKAPQAPKLPPGFRGEFLANLNEVQEKIITLAKATPPEAFSWRPAPGVRSISEVYMHIAGSNYFLSTFVGVTAPKMSGDLEKTVTKKADVIFELKKSFEHLRAAAASAKDLEKPVKMFGNQTTYRGVLMTILSHLHEHLGQSIAYARMNGVIPPWSR
jgi:uncharacterized damage-inducible protein DinB